MRKGVLPLQERFDQKWIPEPNSGCWLWTAAHNGSGYGLISNGPPRTSVWYAHRASWLLHKGEDPGGLWVLHRCDNPYCVNPDHLFLGDPSDNTQDCIKKGRSKIYTWYGSRSGMSKLTESAVNIIRKSNKTNSSLAREYGVSTVTVTLAKNVKTWRHIP